jgi:hypothetical protein
VATQREKNLMVSAGFAGGGLIIASVNVLATLPGIWGYIGMILTMLLGFFMIFYGRYAVPEDA